MASFRNTEGRLRHFSYIREVVNEWLDEEMARYFMSVRKSRRLFSEISKAAKIGVLLGQFKRSSCDSFLDWLTLADDRHVFLNLRSYLYYMSTISDEVKLNNFHKLIQDSNVRLLCKSLYLDSDKYERRGRYIKIKTSDGRFMKIEKSVISAESIVVKDLLDSLDDDDSGVIPLPNVSSHNFTEIKLFLEKKRDFQELVDQPAAHYKAWCKAFINRNRPILNTLHLAAEELQIKSLVDLTSQELQRHGRRHTNEYSLQSFHYFSGMSGNNHRSREILEELERTKKLEGFSDVTCKEFKDWFAQIGEDSGKNHLEEFKALMDSPDFRNVCYSIYRGDYRHDEWDRVSLTSSDGEAFEMVKSVAVDQSLFLRNLVGHSWDYGDIIVNCTGNVLYQVIDFCQKTYDFLEVRDFRPMEECLLIVDHFQGWMTGFLKRNRGILSHLDMAADYLNIPSILAVTTEEVADLAARIRDETSIWGQKLSFSAMLSSLYVAVAV